MRRNLVQLSLYFTVFFLASHSPADVTQLLAGEPSFHWLGRSLPVTVTGFASFLFYAIITYLFLFNYYSRVPGMLLLALYIVVGIPLMIGIRFIMQEVIGYALFGMHNYYANMLKLKPYLLDNIPFAVLYSSFGTVFYFIQLSRHVLLEKRDRELQLRNAELSALRSQIQPHFFFNSLNNIYALVYHNRKEALPAISHLSDLMRYMLNNKATEVPLEDELNHIRNYMDLQILRYADPPKIEYSAPDQLESERIAPLLLLPLVENAFKHGSFSALDEPLRVKACVDGGRFQFSVVNGKRMTRAQPSLKLGLENVRRRLALLYGRDGEMDIRETDTLFSVQLRFPLYA